MQRTTLTISTESRSYTVQGTENNIDALFDHLVAETFKPVDTTPSAVEEPEPATSEEPVVPATVEENVVEEPVEAPAPAVEETTVEEVVENRGCASTSEEEGEPKKYGGFLLIKCAHCGEVRGFKPAHEISSYKCDCGGVTELGKLVPLTALCECGKRWRYLTNLTQDSYEMNCIHCGSPIPVFFNDKKGKYETLLEALPPQKGKKKGGKK